MSYCLTIFDKQKPRRAKVVHKFTESIPFFDEKMESIDYEPSKEVS